MKLRDIAAQTDHRPWLMPHNRWVWYQEWNNVVFLHARVDFTWLRSLVPRDIAIETYDGDAWISIVPFRMQKISPRYLPHINAISDFNEINIRTYVTYNGKPGVYFISIEANKNLSCYVAKTVSGLPYHFVPFIFNDHSLSTPHCSFTYQVAEPVTVKTPFDIWATERYCLYYHHRNAIWRYDIHHLPWPLYKVVVRDLHVDHPLFTTGGHSFIPEISHYSPGVRVLAWPAERCNYNK